MMPCVRRGGHAIHKWWGTSRATSAAAASEIVDALGRTKSETARGVRACHLLHLGGSRQKPALLEGEQLLHRVTGGSHFSAFTVEAKRAAHIHRRLPTTVGTVVKLNFADTNAPIHVKVNSNLEEVCLEAQLNHGSSSSSSTHSDEDWSSLFHLSSEGGDVDLAPRSSGSSGPALAALTATVPERWCSLHIEAGSGDVSIEKVREGSLWVRTSGGNIQAREVKASTADISSGGGSLKMDTLSAMSNVSTEGGLITVNRVLGSKLKMDSGGGNIKLTTLYGDEVSISSGGGSMELSHAQAKLLLDVATGGGAVIIGGLEGKARVVSSGGDVELQLHEQAREIEVDSGAGNVTLFLSSKLSTKVEYEGTGIYTQDGKLYQLEKGRDKGELTFPAEEQADGAGGGGGGQQGRGLEQAAECSVRVRCSGVLQVRTRSWLESVTGDAYFI